VNNNELLAEALKATDALIDAFLQKGYSGTGCFVDAFHQLMTERAELMALIQSTGTTDENKP